MRRFARRTVQVSLFTRETRFAAFFSATRDGVGSTGCFSLFLSAINVTSVTNAQNQNDENTLLYFKNDTIVPDTNTPQTGMFSL
jgi:hypothetical protein